MNRAERIATDKEQEETAMKRERSATLGRREFLRTLGAGATVAAAAATPMADQARADSDEKRKARYQPNSKEVREFYRVNHYPTH